MKREEKKLAKQIQLNGRNGLTTLQKAIGSAIRMEVCPNDIAQAFDYVNECINLAYIEPRKAESEE